MSEDVVRDAERLLRRSRKLLAAGRALLLSADVTCELRARRINAGIKRRAQRQKATP